MNYVKNGNQELSIIKTINELRKKRESGAQYNKNYQYDFEQYGKKNY